MSALSVSIRASLLAILQGILDELQLVSQLESLLDFLSEETVAQRSFEL